MCIRDRSGLAAATTRVGLGPLVMSVTYRHPAVIANWAATTDRVSHGRLVLGLGAGWEELEHRAYGLRLGPLREDVYKRQSEERQLVVLGPGDLGEVKALLAVENPRTDADPGKRSNERWVGARDASGALVACGVRELSLIHI